MVFETGKYSSNINKIELNPQNNEVIIEFKSGGLYKYKNVPSEYIDEIQNVVNKIIELDMLEKTMYQDLKEKGISDVEIEIKKPVDLSIGKTIHKLLIKPSKSGSILYERMK